MMKILYTSTAPTAEAPALFDERPVTKPSFITNKLLISFFVAVLLIAGTGYTGITSESLTLEGALTLAIFILAIWAWVFSPLSDTYVSLAAAVALVLTGIITTDQFTASFGTSAVWLLVAAVVMAQALTASGLTRRLTARLVALARTPRQLAHLYNLALFLTVYLVPSPSGRAALALPIYQAMAEAMPERTKLIKALGILAPSTILVSAVASFIGAGAHLVTAEILAAYGLETIGFLEWMVLGSGLGLAASLLVTELVFILFPTRDGDDKRIHITLADFETEGSTPVRGSLTQAEKNITLTLAIAIALWCTESFHGLDPVIVAVLGALAASAPVFGAVKLGPALKKAPWPMLVFMATTLAIGTALSDSGAATWLAEAIFAPVSGLGRGGAAAFILLVIALSTVAHLVIQSRSARSAVLVPLIITAAIPLGVNPVAAAFISTAAAGFCHTLTSSAKPVALFASIDGHTTYTSADLLKLSIWLAPLHSALIAGFAFYIWPAMGLPLYL
ncbi:SLC13 family permease [Rothia nasimurium]|uniref:SLC13 family permease n=1 Tax=Rothia nasimurium TaxID=85336 RepID=UPI001F014598|nr:SLC13 family permease [Rothia nasimurium]